MEAGGFRRQGAGPLGPRGLVWVNPEPVQREEPSRAGLRLVPPSAIPPRPVKLDLAIERQLVGADGLTRDQFLVVFSGRSTPAPAPALS